MLAVALVAFTACETPEGPEGGNKAKGTLTVTEKSVDVAFYGGEGVVNYTITDGEEGAKPTVTVNQEWVNNITVADTITFNVDFNNVEESRVATLNVAYGEQSFDVFVRQAEGMAVDVEFVATALNGEYYGTAYSQDPNYFAILSKNGTTGWSDLYLDTYYRFDIYSTQSTDASAPVLPQGVYAYDYLNSGVGDTFGDFYSVRMETYENGQYKETKINDGVIIITENKIEAILKMVDGKVHRVVYEGSLALGYIEVPAPDYYSTLTEDHIFNHPDGTIRLNYYGDYYGVGAANWVVSMVLPGTKINGDYFSIDLVANTDEYNVSSIFGTYTCAADESQVAKNTFIAGDYQDGKFLYSWYFVCVDDTFGSDDIAPLTDGTITISEVDGKYVVTYDCMDDNGHKIQGTYTCSTLEMYDSTQY